MTQNLEELKKRLRFRCAHRGFNEMDQIMGHFAATQLDTLQLAELQQLEALLALPDWDVYGWLVAVGEGQGSVPADAPHALLQKIRQSIQQS